MTRPALLDSLLAKATVRARDTPDAAHIALGDAAVDTRLRGGLERGTVHEFYADSADDSGAATGFAAMVAQRACARGQALIWLDAERASRPARLYGPGLVELGIDPAAILVVQAPDALAALAAAADAIKCAGAGAIVLQLRGKAQPYDLTASRRLAMAAARSGVVALVVRIDAQARPSAAQTRWSVAAAASLALAANAPGHPAFDIELLRHRAGLAGFAARLEWNRDTGCFASLPRSVPAVAPVRTDQARLAA